MRRRVEVGVLLCLALACVLCVPQSGFIHLMQGRPLLHAALVAGAAALAPAPRSLLQGLPARGSALASPWLQ